MSVISITKGKRKAKSNEQLTAENKALREQVAQLENALCEIDGANAERFASIEDALCEIDVGG